VFESPLRRLGKDHGDQDACYRGGFFLTPGERPEIESYARELSSFLDTARDHVCGRADSGNETDKARARFRVHVVAHSMGGLISRCFLQHIGPDLKDPIVVDKIFTYGAPHDGVGLPVVGNLLNHLPINNADALSRPRMREHLGLDCDQDVHSLDEKCNPDRFLCLIGTNSRSYGAGHGVLAIHSSDPSSGCRTREEFDLCASK
jgi:pimeloyl-ACP methyl ester carboxylesterase